MKTKIKNISVIGLGKLGGSMAACFASRGFNVVGVDVNDSVVRAFNCGRAPFEETDLDKMIKAHKKRISATQSIKDAVLHSQISFVVVPTPSERSGSFSLKFAKDVFKKIGQAIRKSSHYHVVVLSSTVLPGSCRYALLPILERESGKKCGVDFGLCYSPEFIALGSVIRDFLNPDYCLIGQFDKTSGDKVESVLQRVCLNMAPVKRMTIENAELAKISLNSFVTLKISFANMLAQFCERIPGGDVDVVTDALGMDRRIGRPYLTGGLGFAGPCFPRDNVALNYIAKKLQVDSRLIKINHKFNQSILSQIIKNVSKYLIPKSKIGILGLAYKPFSNVIDESPGVYLCRILAKRGFQITGHDSKAISSAKSVLSKKILLTKSLNHVVRKAKILIVTTNDKNYQSKKFISLVKQKREVTLIDCWRKFRELSRVPTIRYVPIGVCRNNNKHSKSISKLWKKY
jgi:UDPglucose 6-dehydrogenase